MSPAHRRKATELFERLRDLPPDESERLLSSECGSDATLRDVVRELLAANTVSAGAQLGQYRLIRVIGAGGMGIVYEALDERLERSVALKVLNAGSVRDPDALLRFKQEARAASLLNHPNIVSVYDADEDNGRHYLVTELVPGRTLRAVIEERPLATALILEIAIQLAAALEAAHEAGIIHRDIKPENVMIRPDGFIKLLDFGLAKLRHSPTPANDLILTRPGQLAGTLHYLSPEQVLGKPLGPVSDIFSLGVVLYEAATGVRPFDGPTDGAVFDAIANRPAMQPSEHRPGLDPAICSVILRALEKDPELRFQTAADLRASFRRVARDSAFLPAPPRRRFRLWKPVAATFVGALAASALWWGLAPARIGDLPERVERLTGGEEQESWPSAAPDGGFFVYSAVAGGQSDIYLQRRGGTTALNLTADSPSNDLHPAVSPDGGRIAFRSERFGGGIFIMEATGENPRKLTSAGFNPAWSPDGNRVAFSEASFVNPSERGPASALYVLDVATGRQRRVPTGDAVQPSWSPHGWRLAYWGRDAGGGQRDIQTVGTEENPGPPVAATADAALDWNPVWSPDGDALYFLSDRGGAMNVWRVAINERTGRTLGSPEPVTVPAGNVRFLSLPAKGAGFVYAQVQLGGSVGVVDFDPAGQQVTSAPRRILTGQRVTNMSFSPDGKQIVSDAVGDHREDLWIMNRDGTGRRRLTEDPYKDRTPSWSPRGGEIAFFSDRGGKYDTWLIRPDGSGLRRLTDSPYPMQMQVWNRDGSRILAAQLGHGNVWLDPKSPTPLRDLPLIPGLPDGQGVLFSSYPSAGDLLAGERAGNLLIYSLATGKAVQPGVSANCPTWIPGTGEFLFGRGGKAILFDPVRRRERELFSVEPNQLYGFAIPPGGKQIYFSEVVSDADLWYAWLPAPGKTFGIF
ncbi:MAG: protein kinase [Bryobacteraceae bacterium]